ncbi:MAG: hypothetical protein ACJ8HI_19300 [Massilia sp.]
MKRIAPVVVLFLFAMIAWKVFRHSHGIDMDFDDEDFDGPVGAIFGLLFAGGGLVIGGLVALFVGAVLAVVFAGVGVVLVAALALVALLVAAALTPVMLPVLIPAAIIWWLVSRRHKHKTVAA